MTTRLRCLLALTLCWGITGSSVPSVADEPAASPPLHERIDALLDSARTGPVAGLADDAQFLRRVMLDLVGRIPTAGELREFLADESGDKRPRKVDELLNSTEFPRHMAVTFDLMLMERRGGQHVKTEEFREYLRQSFEQNKPYRELVRELLQADGTEDRNRPAAAFYLERDVEPTLLTRELGRVFFGVDLQCAQCHDHPLIDDYQQTDYYGLNAFVVRTSLFRPDTKQPGLLAEKADGEAAFKSVFTDREGMTGPRLPESQEIVEPVLKAGEQYEVEPAKDVRPIPRYSRLQKLAEVVSAGNNPAFDRNIANRLWGHMFGRGLVHPVDLHHSGNPPSHPEVLELIAGEFAAMNHDVKGFLRELALTQAYQRSTALPEDLTLEVDAARQQIAQLQAQAETLQEQARQTEVRVEQVITELDAAVAEAKPLRDAISKANQALAEAQQKLHGETEKLAVSRKAVEEKAAQAQTVATAADAARLAAETVKEDQELAAAATTIQQKSAVAAADVTRLQEAAAAQQKVVDEAAARRKEADAAADAAIAQLAPVDERVRNLRERLQATRAEAMVHRRQSAIARNRAGNLQTLVAYGEQTTQIAALRQSLPALEAALAQAGQRMQQGTEVVAARRAAQEQAKQELARAQEALKQAQGGLAGTQQTAGLLVESLAKATEAQTRLGEAGELPAAVTALNATLASVQTSVQQAEKVVADRQDDLAAKNRKTEAAQTELAAAEGELKAATAHVAEVQQQLSAAREQLTELLKVHDGTWNEIIDHAASRFDVAGIIPLTPEQLGWSILYATGQADRLREAERARLDKEQPLPEGDQGDPVKVTARERQIDEATYARLNGTVQVFVNLFGAGKGQPQHDFFATAEQALFFANGNELRSWLAPAGENLTARLAKLEAASELAEELYLSVLSRQPNPQETEDVVGYLAARQAERPAAIQELAWALITSAEFRFQH